LADAEELAQAYKAQLLAKDAEVRAVQPKQGHRLRTQAWRSRPLTCHLLTSQLAEEQRQRQKLASQLQTAEAAVESTHANIVAAKKASCSRVPE
jgi:hypothetical protein